MYFGGRFAQPPIFLFRVIGVHSNRVMMLIMVKKKKEQGALKEHNTNFFNIRDCSIGGYVSGFFLFQ